MGSRLSVSLVPDKGFSTPAGKQALEQAPCEVRGLARLGAPASCHLLSSSIFTTIPGNPGPININIGNPGVDHNVYLF